MNKRNFWLLVLLLITLPMVAAIFQNTFTTAATGKTPINLPSDPGPVNPIVHKSGDGTILVDDDFTQTGTNANLTGILTNWGTLNSNSFTLVAGAGAGKFLGSDASGNGTWQSVSSSASPTNTPIVLGLSSTNFTGGDWSLGSASGTTFKATLTGNDFMSASTFSNVPTTNGQQNCLLYVYQDATGGRQLNWTNGVFAFVNGVAPVQTTNAGAVDVYSLFNDLQTNNQINVVPANNLHR